MGTETSSIIPQSWSHSPSLTMSFYTPPTQAYTTIQLFGSGQTNVETGQRLGLISPDNINSSILLFLVSQSLNAYDLIHSLT